MNTLATMLTLTTYGTWLRGDRRGWGYDGKILPADPDLESRDRAAMKHEPFRFDPTQCLNVGSAIVASLTDRLPLDVLALTVQTWHAHFVIGSTSIRIGDVVKCVKDAARYRLRPARPIWTTGYDKRFCFDAASVTARCAYVDRHNAQLGLPPRPFDALVDPTTYLARGQ